MALLYGTYALAFTPGLLADTYAGKVTTAMLDGAGYVHFGETDDRWWVPTGRQVFDPAAFYLPVEVIDPFGKSTSITYDDYKLLVTEVEDAIGNVVAAENDYRTMSPVVTTDANGNRVGVLTDELGMVIASAIMGKESESLGDAIDPDDLTKATTYLEYDLFRWKNEGKPAVVHTAARETHSDPGTRWVHSYTYSDGSGHEVMKKAQAAPGDAPKRDGNGDLVYESGELVLAPSDPRWMGTGRTVFDNKGNPIKKYEPFFSATHEYETDDDLVQWGVTPLLHYDPLGRLIRTDLPNGTSRRVELTPWEQIAYDENDTVLEEGNLWVAARQPSATPAPSSAEQRAAALAAAHAGTPTVTHFDTLGRPFLVVQDNGNAERLETRTVLDIEGNSRTIVDALGRDAMAQEFDMLGTVTRTLSIDAGERWMLTDVLGASCRAWDSRHHLMRRVYDELRRPTHLFVKHGEDDEVLAKQTIYGEGIADPIVKNHRGRVYEQLDGAGRVRFVEYDFKGNVVETTRQLATAYETLVDWSSGDADDLVEDETFATATAYDALNRPTAITTPDGSVSRVEYNDAGLLEAVDVKVRRASTATTFVDDIAYDAKGQREEIVYGNGTITKYEYDSLTFRLVRIRTKRTSDGAILQDLLYTYDPVGNIVAIKDTAQQTVFFDNGVVEPSSECEYDAIYRLVNGSGREHRSLAEVPRDQGELPLHNLPHANDAQALRRYEERYQYDAVGGILRMIHDAGLGNAGSWTRGYRYGAASNRLEATSVGGDDVEDPQTYSAEYTHDAHGNMVSMPHLAGVEWDFKDQMRAANKGGGGNVYFTYDAAGQRVRKVWVHSGIVEERIYLGGNEVYRRHESGSLKTERQTLHAMDDARRIAMVETLTVDEGEEIEEPEPRLRMQLDNHLGSALLEVDEAGAVISYEESHPYGTTAHWAAASGVEVSQRRYRYTGKEKDEETGLYYHGARYYAPWLGRWTAADPAGMVDGPNLYGYVGGNPIKLVDPKGQSGIRFELGDENFRKGTSEERLMGATERMVGQAEIDFRDQFGLATTTRLEYGMFGSGAQPEAVTLDLATKDQQEKTVEAFEATLEQRIRAGADKSETEEHLRARIDDAKQSAKQVRDYLIGALTEGHTVEVTTNVDIGGKGLARDTELLVGFRHVGGKTSVNPFTFYAEESGGISRSSQASSPRAQATLGPGMQLLHELEPITRRHIDGRPVESEVSIQQTPEELNVSADVDKAVQKLPGLLPRSGYGGKAGKRKPLNERRDWFLYPEKETLESGLLPKVRPDALRAPFSR